MSQALEGKRVLLVDDDNDILISMQAAFEPTGAIIDTAHDGNRAVELAERISGDSSVAHAMAFCQAIESLAGITIPARAA